jgi:hypothetical protein
LAFFAVQKSRQWTDVEKPMNFVEDGRDEARIITHDSGGRPDTPGFG